MPKKNKKQKKPSASRAPAPKQQKNRHVDSVVTDDDVYDLSGYAAQGGPSPEVLPAPKALTVLPASGVPMVSDPALVSGAARDLILQAKTALSKKAGYFPAHISLVLENDVEVDAAMMLEHMGRGKLFKDNNEWVFEFNEETPGGVGGVLKGDVLKNKD